MWLHTTTKIYRSPRIKFIDIKISLTAIDLLLISIMETIIRRLTTLRWNDGRATHSLITFLNLMQNFTLNLAISIGKSSRHLIMLFIQILALFIEVSLQLCLHLESTTRVPFGFNLIIVFVVSLNTFFIFLINTITIIF